MEHPFYSIFEDWMSNKAVGLSVLQTFDGHLYQALQQPASSTLSATMQRIQAMAPSSTLAAYNSAKGVTKSKQERTIFELQDEYIILQNCAREALILSQRLHLVTDHENLTQHSPALHWHPP
ncbi:hypothetical protein CEUSTIGMA_g5443.t1 [Chlamydomonas eustigma]|uniref:Uncharacterized protein n=1 Tax=Chlamydomonas eustigma TaxID=1157962 RepID=A0A250X4L1_9CHLO|nr:hypothetical protein CEUSTIGMA_g5443.t1 [Chlamydomonas eustigma]|eukprot:GAX78001.1 hypothetical protein CEUSTIGMA_g5443.t1 [Chlamydomonas eustigma]